MLVTYSLDGLGVGSFGKIERNLYIFKDWMNQTPQNNSDQIIAHVFFILGKIYHEKRCLVFWSHHVGGSDICKRTTL